MRIVAGKRWPPIGDASSSLCPRADLELHQGGGRMQRDAALPDPRRQETGRRTGRTVVHRERANTHLTELVAHLLRISSKAIWRRSRRARWPRRSSEATSHPCGSESPSPYRSRTFTARPSRRAERRAEFRTRRRGRSGNPGSRRHVKGNADLVPLGDGGTVAERMRTWPLFREFPPR